MQSPEQLVPTSRTRIHTVTAFTSVSIDQTAAPIESRQPALLGRNEKRSQLRIGEGFLRSG
jgi:hypothetical protein